MNWRGGVQSVTRQDISTHAHEVLRRPSIGRTLRQTEIKCRCALRNRQIRRDSLHGDLPFAARPPLPSGWSGGS